MSKLEPSSSTRKKHTVNGEIFALHIFLLNSRFLKPIFHQNAKYLASGTNAKDSIFASPNAKNTNMLVSFALGDANFLRWPCTFHFLCVDFFALGSKRKPHFQWNIGCVGSLALGLCVGHVHFIFFVLISFASGTQRKPVFWWNMGLNILEHMYIVKIAFIMPYRGNN